MAVSYLNSALCNLKSNRHTQAKNDCENALNIEPTNVKAIYRKGEVCITHLENLCLILLERCGRLSFVEVED